LHIIVLFELKSVLLQSWDQDAFCQMSYAQPIVVAYGNGVADALTVFPGHCSESATSSMRMTGRSPRP